jgi:hypothetical protein
MSDWDLISIAKILIGCSISATGIIIAAIVLGIPVPYGPFLIFTSIVLTVLCAAVIIILQQQEENRVKTKGET